ARPLLLYLRSFRLGRSTLLGRLLPWNWGLTRWWFDRSQIEEDVANAISGVGVLIAIGNKGDSYGAGKIITSDETWKSKFDLLAEGSLAIFVLPDTTASVKWEIAQILSRQKLLQKTIWVIPAISEKRWSPLRDELFKDLGFLLPHGGWKGG